MKCPKCGHNDLKVLDTREYNGGMTTKRRRVCLKCGAKYLTHETFEEHIILVIKKDGSKEKFWPDKILKSILKALEGQNIPINEIEEMAERIENNILKTCETDITTDFIKEKILVELKAVSKVGYIQYLIHSEHINTIDELKKEIDKVENE